MFRGAVFSGHGVFILHSLVMTTNVTPNFRRAARCCYHSFIRLGSNQDNAPNRQKADYEFVEYLEHLTVDQSPCRPDGYLQDVCHTPSIQHICLRRARLPSFPPCSVRRETRGHVTHSVAPADVRAARAVTNRTAFKRLICYTFTSNYYSIS